MKGTANVVKLLLKEYILWINLIDIKSHKYISMLWIYINKIPCRISGDVAWCHKISKIRPQDFCRWSQQSFVSWQHGPLPLWSPCHAGLRPKTERGFLRFLSLVAVTTSHSVRQVFRIATLEWRPDTCRKPHK